MTVLVCGGRDYADIATVFTVLDEVRPDRVVTGGASGADALAADWTHDVCAELVEYQADWRKHGKAAGPIRNQQMLDSEKIDLVIAFPGGRGTRDMTIRADIAGIPVRRVANG